MSLLHLVHKSVIIKFSDAAKSQFNPEISYAFRLTGVDGMGFLQVEELRAGSEGAEVASDAYWINKDLVREIHEAELASTTLAFSYSGKAVQAKPEVKPEPKIEPAPREVSPKLPKAKVPAKKSVLKQKPVFN